MIYIFLIITGVLLMVRGFTFFIKNDYNPKEYLLDMGYLFVLAGFYILLNVYFATNIN